MKSLVYIFVTLLFGFAFLEVAFAETLSGSSDTSFGQVASSSDLSMVSVKTIDSLHIRVTFSEDIDVPTVKAQLTQQSDSGSTIRIVSLTGVSTRPDAVDMTLASGLTAGSTYSITLLSAVAKSGAIIRDGALAIKTFTTPSPLPEPAPTTLNAPSNPTAVTAGSTGTVGVSKIETATGKLTSTGNLSEKKPVLPSEELPLTGMNPLFLLVLILPFAYFFMRKHA